jgi:YfiH family protein
MKSLQSSLLSQVHGIVHGFGTREEPIPRTVLAQGWEKVRPQWKQVHGVAIAQVSVAGQLCGEVDALWTRSAELPIAVFTADCVPVLLARKDGQMVAAVHAGWRGTRAHILRALWKDLSAQGESPSEWVAAIGPAIGPCCYEVSEEIASDFEREFSGLGEKVAVPRHRILDLPEINSRELSQIGVGKVEILRFCTRCDEGFHSYRREGGGTRQYSAISRSG